MKKRSISKGVTAIILVACMVGGSLTSSVYAAEYQIAGGGAHTLVIKPTTGEIWTWGDGGHGQLGVGDVEDRNSPVRPIGLPPMKAIGAGGSHSLAAATGAGIVYVWGSNNFGQLGDGTTTERLVPKAIDLYGATALEGGANHSLAIAAGVIYAWGKNTDGQVGDGTFQSPRSSPVAVVIPGKTIVSVAAGDHHSLALATDGTVWAWGGNQWGQLGGSLDYGVSASSPIQVTGGGIQNNVIKAIATGGEHSVALDTQGRVWTWGKNAYEQLAVDSGLYSARKLPMVVNGISKPVVEVAGEGPFTVARDTVGNIWAWGHDVYGQLGDGNYGEGVTFETPRRVMLANGNPLSGVVSLGAAHFHAVAESYGALYSWGKNLDWRLGQGNLVNNLPLRPRAAKTVQPN